MPYCEANDKAEYCELADVGLLALPSSGPKLPDREWAALLSLPPADCPVWICRGRGACSCGATWLPIGVARCRVGRAGRDDPAAGPGALPTGFALGDGGMARPSLGVRAPPGRPPVAGRRDGGADGNCGTGRPPDDCYRAQHLYISRLREHTCGGAD